MKQFKLIHTILAIFLGLFFITVGIKKFLPKEKRNASSKIEQETANNKQIDLENSVHFNTYEKPHAFVLSVRSMSKTGYLKIVGCFQVLAGLLLCYGVTRLVGAMVLLPIILNIFLFHLVMNADMFETIKTFALVCVNLLIIYFYKIRLNDLLIKHEDIQSDAN